MSIKGIKRWAAAGALFFWSFAAWADYKLNLQTPYTLLARKSTICTRSLRRSVS